MTQRGFTHGSSAGTTQNQFQTYFKELKIIPPLAAGLISLLLYNYALDGHHPWVASHSIIPLPPRTETPLPPIHHWNGRLWKTMLGKKRAQWTRDRGNAMQKFIPLLSGKTLSCSQPAHSIFFMGNLMTKQFNSANNNWHVCCSYPFAPSCAVRAHTDIFLLFAFAPQNCAFHVCSFVHCELH